MSTIEPTEEQRKAAASYYLKSTSGPVRDWIETGVVSDDAIDTDVLDLADLLAEREHKLRAKIEELEEQLSRRLADSTAIDALAYAVACLELQPGSERDRAVRDAMSRVICHVGAIEVQAKDSATKLVGTLVAGAKAREAAHLAHIKALREAAGKVALRTAVDGPCWCSYPIPPRTDHHLCCEHMRRTLAATNLHDTEGGER
jgi:hypothetical protein